MNNFNRMPKAFAYIGVIALFALGAAGWYMYRNARADLHTATQENDALAEKIIELEGNLALAEDENEALAEALKEEEDKNAQIEEQVLGIAETVGTLEKLSKTDEELLQKYSKVYFLNEHYIPSELVNIDPEFLLSSTTMKIHAKVEPNLNKMIEEAKEDGVELRIVSAYRSFGTQATLKAGYTVVYGSGANAFSADQGYSEHQLGTTVDFTTPALGSLFTSFAETEAYTWLQDNAYKFGFILSYPQNNAYYQFEPWHWRFVGENLARFLHREEIFFYDLDQRKINEYLVSIFD